MDSKDSRSLSACMVSICLCACVFAGVQWEPGSFTRKNNQKQKPQKNPKNEKKTPKNTTFRSLIKTTPKIFIKATKNPTYPVNLKLQCFQADGKTTQKTHKINPKEAFAHNFSFIYEHIGIWGLFNIA